jgi:hypothetical protein
MRRLMMSRRDWKRSLKVFVIMRKYSRKNVKNVHMLTHMLRSLMANSLHTHMRTHKHMHNYIYTLSFTITSSWRHFWRRWLPGERARSHTHTQLQPLPHTYIHTHTHTRTHKLSNIRAYLLFLLGKQHWTRRWREHTKVRLMHHTNDNFCKGSSNLLR